MCFEYVVGFTSLALALVGYVISYAFKNVNWALHMFYFKKWLSAKCRVN